MNRCEQSIEARGRLKATCRTSIHRGSRAPHTMDHPEEPPAARFADIQAGRQPEAARGRGELWEMLARGAWVAGDARASQLRAGPQINMLGHGKRREKECRFFFLFPRE